MKEKVKAFVLKDGQVIPDQLLQRYALKESKQIKGDDEFTSFYQQNQIVQPKYDPKLLADLMERNTYHYRASKTKAKDTVGLGWNLVPLVEHPSEKQKAQIEQLLHYPHPDQTLEEIFTQWMEDYEATGNGYLEVIKNQEVVVGFEHIPAHTMRRHKDEVRYVQVRGNRKRWFKKIGTKEAIDVITGEIRGDLSEEQQANEIIHIMNYTSGSDYYGSPDILPALGALLGDEHRQSYNIDFFENYAIPSYAVTVAGAELDEETMERIRQYFQKDLKENRHSTLVLSAPNPLGDGPAVEFQFEKLAVDVSEASFRLYRMDNRDEVLAAHGVPPYRMGIAETGSLGGSTAVESTEIYKDSIIQPRQQMIESRINRHILRDALGITDWSFRFNEIDTRDEERDTQIYQMLFQMGAITPNQIREKLGEERMEHPLMDQTFIGGVPLDQIQLPRGQSELIAEIKSLHHRLLDVVTK